MDLEMIQDLLGEPNLPPPPSVQDLLGDVEPIARSPSPPLPSLPCPEEHSYSRSPSDPQADEPMDHTPSPGSQTVASLNPTSDSFESFLLNLLKAFTQHQIETVSGTAASGEAAVFTIDSISPEALDSLSQEQVQALVTSNSINYDVIQQILAHKQKTEGGELTDYSGVLAGISGGGRSQNLGLALPGKSEGGGGGGGGEKVPDEALSALQQLQALQLSPEQLKQIQLQMTELIRTKQIVLPTELSLDQQQQLLQSLLLRQVHAQQETKVEPASSGDGSGKSTGSPVTVGSTLAVLLGKEGGGEAGKVVQMEVPPPSSMNTQDTAIQLQTNPVAKSTSSTAASSTVSTATSPVTTATNPVTTATGPVTTRGGRRKKEAKDEPKKPSQPYGIFFSDVYPTVVQANPKMSFSEASKIISMMWNAMGSDTKKQYYNRSEKQKEEYKTFLENKRLESEAAEREKEKEKEKEKVDVLNLLTAQPSVPSPPQPPAALEPSTFTKQIIAAVSGTQTDTPAQEETAPAPSQPKETPVPPQPKPSKDYRLCVNNDCMNTAVFMEIRGPRYCSNECVVQHCRSEFQEWVSQRKLKT